jgi:hypothetical protein
MRYRWQDLRTGEMLVERPMFIHQTSYIPAFESTVQGLSIRGIDGMAERIVETMETGW